METARRAREEITSISKSRIFNPKSTREKATALMKIPHSGNSGYFQNFLSKVFYNCLKFPLLSLSKEKIIKSQRSFDKQRFRCENLREEDYTGWESCSSHKHEVKKTSRWVKNTPGVWFRILKESPSSKMLLEPSRGRNP